MYNHKKVDRTVSILMKLEKNPTGNKGRKRRFITNDIKQKMINITKKSYEN